MRRVGLDIRPSGLYYAALLSGFMEGLPRFLIFSGLALVAVGLMLWSGRFSWLGHLPGDIVIRREGFTFYFPLATSVLISIVLSFLAYLLRR